MKYAIVIETPGNYSAYAPDLPGCVAVGDTLEEVEQAMREAIEFHEVRGSPGVSRQGLSDIEGMQQEGLLIPMPTSIGKMLELSIARVKRDRLYLAY